ncbi:MAG: hypothetical protein HDT43_11005 [Ruminococcaceae bacterium]|nr:hypothetical protein [Oscillospiraceae bacterium]
MNKLFKKAAAIFAGAVIVMSSVTSTLVFTKSPVYAEDTSDGGNSDTSDNGNSNTGTNTTVTGPETTFAEPIFMFTTSSTSTIEAGQEGMFSLDIKNLGQITADRVLIEVTAPNDIVLANNSGVREISSIYGGGSTSIVLRYRALNRITSAKQTFTISMRYYYDTGNGETLGSANGSVDLNAKISNDGTASAEPIFKITPKNISEIKSGESGYFNVELKNLGALEAKRILVETTPSEDVILTDGSGSQDISSISPNSTSTVKISYKALGKINSAKQAFNISLRYYYEGEGGEAIGTASSTVNVPADAEALAEVSAPSIKITGQTLSLPITASSEYEYTLTVRNYSDTPAEDVFLFLDASDSLYFINGTENAEVGSIPAKGSASVNVRFRTVNSIAAVKQGITAHISYSYMDGGVKKTAESDSSVTIIASESGGGSGGNSGMPNIIIKSYDIGAEQIPAGDSFDLALTLFNTSTLTGVENVIMTINAGGSINIFGGTNTFYYPTIEADGEISENIPLKALATAETGTSSISVSLKYDYFDNGSRSTANIEQTIFIPVYQPDKMTFEVNVPTYSVMVGEDVYITTTYLNKGRSEIANVKAEIVGEVGALSTSKVIGTVQPGGNGSFDFIVTPYEGGTCEFTILVTYEDATLTEVQRELPVSFEVEDMWSDPGFMDDPWLDPGFEDPGMEEGGKFPWVIVWICAGVIVVGGVVAIILVAKHKKKKKTALTEADIDWEDEFDDPKPNATNNNNDNNTTTV